MLVDVHGCTASYASLLSYLRHYYCCSAQSNPPTDGVLVLQHKTGEEHFEEYDAGNSAR